MKSQSTKQRQLCTHETSHKTRYEAAHQHEIENNDLPVDYVTPQKPLRDPLYPTMFRTPTHPPDNSWSTVPPPAPVKASPRSSRIAFPRHAVPGAVVSSFQPQPRTAPSTSISSPPSLRKPIISPQIRQNPISPPNPIRTALVKSSLPSSKSTSGSEMKIEYKVEEPSELLVMNHNPFRTPRFIYERVGMPHLRVFRVKLPQLLIDLMDSIIEGAEQHAQSLRKGWKTELYSLTKCDVACRDIPGICKYVRPILDFVCNAIHALYGVPKLMVDRNQPHVLKYSAEMNHTGGRQFIHGAPG
jgi:hypothetical protein